MEISIEDLERMLKSHSDSEKEEKPLANPEIVDGIEQREVNKAKGV